MEKLNADDYRILQRVFERLAFSYILNIFDGKLLANLYASEANYCFYKQAELKAGLRTIE